jgi:hypothetical protein
MASKEPDTPFANVVNHPCSSVAAPAISEVSSDELPKNPNKPEIMEIIAAINSITVYLLFNEKYDDPAFIEKSRPP